MKSCGRLAYEGESAEDKVIDSERAALHQSFLLSISAAPAKTLSEE
jgi:hypothetical protein